MHPFFVRIINLISVSRLMIKANKRRNNSKSFVNATLAFVSPLCKIFGAYNRVQESRISMQILPIKHLLCIVLRMSSRMFRPKTFEKLYYELIKTFFSFRGATFNYNSTVSCYHTETFAALVFASVLLFVDSFVFSKHCPARSFHHFHTWLLSWRLFWKYVLTSTMKNVRLFLLSWGNCWRVQ